MNRSTASFLKDQRLGNKAIASETNNALGIT